MEAVIFDMDGVLIDSHSVAIQLLCDTANQYGCGLSVADIQSWGSLSGRQFWSRVKTDYQLPHELNELMQAYDVEQEIAMYAAIGLIPGVKQLLQRLRENGVRTALATSASRRRMHAVIAMFELGDDFDQCVCDNEVKQSKPDPEIFLLAAAKLNVDPASCVVIEDSLNGLRAAHAAGMKCIAYKGLPHVREDMTGAEWEIAHFDQIDIRALQRLFE